MQKTFMAKPADVVRSWHLIDAQDQILGRLATQIAIKLIGKHKKEFTPYVDAGDYVVVTNASQIAVTGNKLEDKMYYSHTGYPGALKSKSLGELMAEFPERVIEKAVYNMLPKNKHRSGRMTRLKVYAGSEHPHESQLTKESK